MLAVAVAVPIESVEGTTTIASGNPTLERLFELHARELMGYLRALVRHEASAEDILQEVFTELARRVDSLGGVANLRAYLFAMARNEAMDFLARRRREDRFDLPPVIPLIEPEPDAAERAEEIGRLDAALRSLPGEQREAVFLKCVEEFTFEEIGEMTGVSINTAASRYRYGIQSLRILLEKEE
ncbi:MAG: sigma-70 family RNA polymerase sigma factor [Planctomycetota bacterium]|nr:sigma-70 family RNA polymerase sigma factor [Planctomycetota bacterium]